MEQPQAVLQQEELSQQEVMMDLVIIVEVFGVPLQMAHHLDLVIIQAVVVVVDIMVEEPFLLVMM